MRPHLHASQRRQAWVYQGNTLQCSPRESTPCKPRNRRCDGGCLFHHLRGGELPFLREGSRCGSAVVRAVCSSRQSTFTLEMMAHVQILCLHVSPCSLPSPLSGPHQACHEIPHQARARSLCVRGVKRSVAWRKWQSW